MNRSTVLKIIVLFVSLTMFYLQMKVSIENLTNPPIVTTEERLSLEDIDPPLITICPQDQIDETKLKNLGYENYDDLLLGKAKTGTNKNHSFWEVLDQSLTFSPEKDVDLMLKSNGTTYYMTQFVKTFYASLGYCWDISDYKLTRNIEIENFVNVIKCNISEFKVYVTDKSLVSMPTTDLSTHVGNDILFEKGMKKSCWIEITRFSSYNPKNVDYCKNYVESEFKSCVDDHVSSTFSIQSFNDYLLCHPLYLTNINACSDMKWIEAKNLTFYADFAKSIVFRLVLGKILDIESFVDEGICQPPCTVTRSNVKIGKGKTSRDRYQVNLKFAETIIYSKAEFGYNFSNFLVDLGSAVGLWFGISVFGLTDLGMQLFSVGKETWRKVKSLSKI